MSLCPAPKALTSNNQVLLLNQHLTPKLNIVLFFLPGTPSFHYLFLFIILIFVCWEFSFFEKVIYEYNMYLYHFPFSLLPQTSSVHPLTLLLLSSLIIINIYNNTMSFSIAQGHMCLSDHPGLNSLSRVLILGKDWFSLSQYPLIAWSTSSWGGIPRCLPHSPWPVTWWSLSRSYLGNCIVEISVVRLPCLV